MCAQFVPLNVLHFGIRWEHGILEQIFSLLKPYSETNVSRNNNTHAEGFSNPKQTLKLPSIWKGSWDYPYQTFHPHGLRYSSSSVQTAIIVINFNISANWKCSELAGWWCCYRCSTFDIQHLPEWMLHYMSRGSHSWPTISLFPAFTPS